MKQQPWFGETADARREAIWIYCSDGAKRLLSIEAAEAAALDAEDSAVTYVEHRMERGPNE